METKESIQETKPTECDCISKVAERIREQAIADRSKALKGYKMINSRWEHRSLLPKVRLYSNFIIEYTFQKKDGSTSKPRNEHASIFYSYCPFCGTKISTE